MSELAGPPARWGTALVVSTTAFTLALFGTTVVNVALPAIRRDLGGGVAELQWIANGYSLMLASLLLTTGALCDQRGARRVMLAGVSVFGVGATLGALAPSLEALVVAQLTLGAGAAALIPASLTLVSHAYPEPTTRARAIAVYSSASAAAVAAGPVVGGVLIDAIAWRAVFAIDVPVVLVIAALVLLRLDETPHQRARRLDLSGQALGFLALGSLTFGLIESGARGWGAPETQVPVGVAILAGVAFIAGERRAPAPMLSLSIFRSGAFSVASASGLLFNFAVYGELFVLSLYLQDIRHLSPLDTGLLFAALPVAAALTALPSGRMTSRSGARLPAAIGAGLASIGAVALLPMGLSTPHGIIIAGLLLIGTGGGLAIPALTTAVLTATPSPQMGMATATFTASRQVGGMLGVAVLGAMVSSGSFVDGMRLSLVIAAATFLVCCAAALLAITPEREQPRAAAPTPARTG